ncbi:ricin-type beta-trefoil lectin domain protein [Streptomyces sp. ISL-66]|uniref:ricin-type beta-trefoil lectin domain protein n=1 Tax=Streptomyces sp. ISL-66 TaxID=2819186 RepID=UPI001BE8FC64|nr:ricin-type beta-trefoil lectin domain protein [Streptomyces sp. ISL-66]MBT2472417.1 ricin-type beta-trefoil lectin domain protein [Streptomyces sp. ISL-66]
MAVAVSAAMLLSAPYVAQAATQPPTPPGDTAPTAPAPVTPADKARVEAVKTGKDVPVPELTTEFSTTVVTPQGKLRTERTLLAERTKDAKGQWLALDDTLTAGADGTVVPKASSSALAISGGGTGPLATMTTEDGKQLSVSSPFPGALPKPVLTGNGALFQNVAVDTDLQVNATKWGGYTTVLILRTPAAAANPAVHDLVFPTVTKGLTLSKGEDGSLAATGDGGAAFRAPAPLMWSAKEARQPDARAAKFAAPVAAAETSTDGSGPRATLSSAQGPGTGATVANIPVTRAEVTGSETKASGTIALAPSPDLLDGDNTAYPIYVDPSWSPDARGKQHHAWVGSAWSGTSNFDRTGSADRDHPGVGYQGWETQKGIERSLYEFDVSGYGGAVVNYANLRVSQYISSDWSCTNSYSVSVYRAGEFDSSVNWGNHRIGDWIGDRNIPGNGNSSDCYADIPVDFNVTGAMRDAIRDTSKPLAFALRGPEGTGDKIAFKRFSYNATLSTEYDFPPRVPENPRTIPTPRRVVAGDTQTCAEGPASQYGWITTSNVTLASTVSSPNQGQLTEWVNIWDETASATAHQSWSGFVGSGSEARYTTPLGTLNDGHAYAWETRGDDGLLRGPNTVTCHFAVDLTPPVMQFGQFTDPATQFPPSGNGQITKLGLGDTGTIPITASDASPGTGLRTSGLACIEFGFDPQLVGATRQCGSPLSPTGISVKPTHWGTNIVYARALDEAGNASQTLSYSFYVPWKPGPIAFGDTSGDARPDILLPDNVGNLITYGRATDGTAASMIPSGTTASALQGPEAAAGRTWNDYRVSHRGSRDPGRNVDDLIAHREPTAAGNDGGWDLFVYDNNLANPGTYDLNKKTLVEKPECSSCAGYDSTSWKSASQITMTGPPSKTIRTPGTSVTNTTGFFAVEANKLWYYPVLSSKLLDTPVLVDSNPVWNGKDLIVPGNTLRIGDTKDNAPALWVRDRATGDIFQYAMQTAARGDLTVVTGLAKQPTARIGSGVTAAAYPRVGSDGDLTDDGVPDFWAQDTNGVLHSWAGTTNTPVAGISMVTAFGGVHQVRGNGLTPTFEWRLEGDAQAIPAKNTSGTPNTSTATGVTYPTDQVDGKTRPVAAFDGASTSTVVGPAKVVDTRQSFTLSTWAKLDRTGVIASQDGAHASAFALYADAGNWRFAISRADDDTWPYDFNNTVTAANAFKPGVWTQLTATYSATTGAMSLYVNGTLASSGYHAANTSPAPTGQLVLGRYKYQSKPSDWLTGRIANLSVHQNYVPPVTASKVPIRLAVSPDICMDAPDNDSGNGRRPQIWTCYEQIPAQQFDVNANGTLTHNGQCFAAHSNQTASGTPVIFYNCIGEGGQQWLPRADGSIYNPQSNSCLDDPWDSRVNGTQFQLYTCNGTTAQIWSIPTVTTANLPFSP